MSENTLPKRFELRDGFIIDRDRGRRAITHSQDAAEALVKSLNAGRIAPENLRWVQLRSHQ